MEKNLARLYTEYCGISEFSNEDGRNHILYKEEKYSKINEKNNMFYNDKTIYNHIASK